MPRAMEQSSMRALTRILSRVELANAGLPSPHTTQSGLAEAPVFTPESLPTAGDGSCKMGNCIIIPMFPLNPPCISWAPCLQRDDLTERLWLWRVIVSLNHLSFSFMHHSILQLVFLGFYLFWLVLFFFFNSFSMGPLPQLWGSWETWQIARTGAIS